MNVGLFTDCYWPTKNGVVTLVAQLRDELQRRGYRVTIVTAATPGHPESDVDVYRFPSLSVNSSIKVRLALVSQPAIDRLVHERQLDVLHTHTEFSIAWSARHAAQRWGLPLVHTAHTLYEEYRHYLFWGELMPLWLLRRLLARFLRVYDAVICPSPRMQAYLRACAPTVPAVVIGNGVSRDLFRPDRITPAQRAHVRQSLGIRSTDKVIIYVGRLGKEKRIRELLDALTPLLQRRPQYKALFVGSGPARNDLVACVRQRALGHQVALPGDVAWQQMPELYSIAHVFVSASLSEVHPMTFIEASACGLPIVARRDVAYVDLIEHGNNGYLPDSDAQIAGYVDAVLDDDSHWRRMSENALSRSAALSVERHVDKIEVLYDRVCARLPIPSAL